MLHDTRRTVDPRFMLAGQRLRKQSASSARWLTRHRSDPFVLDRTARPGVEAFRSRSAFKLLSIAQRHSIFPRHADPVIVDLGAAPGGWTQAALQIKRRAKLFALDISPMEQIKGVDTIQGDFTSASTRDELQRRIPTGVDTVLSDMMVPMSGIRDRDIAGCLDLLSAAADFAKLVLKPAEGIMAGGSLVWVGMRYFRKTLQSHSAE